MMEGLSRRGEDYLRVIYELTCERGFTRVKEIAERLAVKPASVTEMLRRLADMGLVVHEKYGIVRLTDEGFRIGAMVKDRHELFVKFLEMLGVPHDVAVRDAHELEHRLSSETLTQIEKFVKLLLSPPDRPAHVRRWLNLLRERLSSR